MDAGFWAIIASVATPVGVLVVIFQIALASRRALTTFEDDLSREYRSIVGEIPVAALLGGELSEDKYAECFGHLYRYIDLCNEQVFLRQHRRVSRRTWRFWRDGIKVNLRRPAFERAWTDIKRRSQDFAELRRLELSGFQDDPRKWGRRDCENPPAAPPAASHLKKAA